MNPENIIKKYQKRRKKKDIGEKCIETLNTFTEVGGIEIEMGNTLIRIHNPSTELIKQMERLEKEGLFKEEGGFFL